MLSKPEVKVEKRRRKKQRSTTRSSRSSRPRLRLDVDERRAQLVELGLCEFGVRTYEEVSIDQIAEAAGISKGLLYHYFPTKRAFYHACVSATAARLIARLDAVVIDPTVPLEGLTKGLDAYLAHVRAHGRAFGALMRGGVGLGREIAAVVDATRATLIERLTTGLLTAFPDAAPVLSSPLVQIALRGWVGFAEAASIEWVEASVAAEEQAKPDAPTAQELRDLLVRTLVSIVQGALNENA